MAEPDDPAAAPDTPDPEEAERGELGPAGISIEAERGARMSPAAAVAAMRIRVPVRGNRILRTS